LSLVIAVLVGLLTERVGCLLCLLQGHTVDVDTALVSTSEVKDYPMILLLGIGECNYHQDSWLDKSATDCSLATNTLQEVSMQCPDCNAMLQSRCALLLSVGYEAETVAKADRDLKDALGPLAYVVSGGRTTPAFSFIHVTPVAEAHLSNASPFQTPLITPNNKLIKPTNKDNFLPG
jgi:hypothetical protein